MYLINVVCIDDLSLQENFFRLRSLTEKARESYREMVASLEHEMAAAEPAAAKPAVGNCGGFEKLFPHLGHSRTPSACSAISFVSSILSEPISENYPQSEPETDSRGYEIKENNKKQPDLDTVGESREEGAQELDASVTSALAEEKPTTFRDSLRCSGDGSEDGHEADTEDDIVVRSRRRESSQNLDTSSAVAMTKEAKDKLLKSTASGLADFIEPRQLQQLSEYTGAISDSPKSEGGVTTGDGEDVSTIQASASRSHESPSLDAIPPDGRRSPRIAVGGSEVDNSASRTSSTRSAINNERIESWVAESQRVIERMRGMSASMDDCSAALCDDDVPGDVTGEDDAESAGGEDGEEDGDEADDETSLKTLGTDDDSDDEYEETTENLPVSAVK